MVEFGHAVAYVKYSKKYLSLQKKPRMKNKEFGLANLTCLKIGEEKINDL